MNQPLKGVGYDLNATNRGFSFSVHDPAYVEPGDNLMMGLDLPTFPFPVIPYFPIPQFQCFATPGTGEYAGKTILKIVAGGVNYTNSNLPNIKEGVEQNFAQAFITKAAVLSSGVSAVNGATPIDQDNPFMLNNGFYVIDSPGTQHYVVISYYDGNGPGDSFDIPILTERTPWVSIVAEGSSEFIKLFIEQGPSYYTGLLNIAPMIDYRNAEDEIFGFGHTSYFKPVKFGANVKIIATIENNQTTQTAHGSQNLTIPLQNNGTRLMYVPGMREFDDPYYSQTGGNFGYVVNKSDITALSSLSYTGGWWDQVTDNTNPRSVTVNNYSYYSVNYEGTDNMREFTCSVIGVDMGESFEHRLRIKSGLVTFKTVVVDDEFGIITTNPEVKNLRITEPNIYPEGIMETGLNENPDYLLLDGYLKLEEGSDYYVFLFKVIPDWSGASESKAPQLVISKVADAPNTDIVTKANGGGYTTAYLMVEEPTPLANIVTADPETGYVGSFDPAVLSDHITFNAQYLLIERDNAPTDRDAYPATMLAWLDAIKGTGSTVPVFLKKSTNPYQGSAYIDGDTVDGVPCGENWAMGSTGGGASVIHLEDAESVYGYYFNEVDSFNYIANDVLTGVDMSAFTYNPANAYNMVSGVIDTQDFAIGLKDSGGPGQLQVVEFTGEDIPITGTTTSLTFLSKENIQDKLIGYTKTSCYRKDIAYIQWDGENSRFIVKQLHNGPVVIEDNPIHLGTTIIATDEEKGWIDGTAPTEDIVGAAFEGYTKNFNTGSTNQPDGSTTAEDYIPNQPSQIESPEIT
jgi:hypothetical protein